MMVRCDCVDVVAGRDPLDSTTVDDPYLPFDLPDDISLGNMHIGIPKVGDIAITYLSHQMDFQSMILILEE